MKAGNLASNLYGWLLPQGTAEPQHPGLDVVIRVEIRTDLHVSAGPEDEFEPDWGAGPGTLCVAHHLRKANGFIVCADTYL